MESWKVLATKKEKKIITGSGIPAHRKSVPFLSPRGGI
jgi:hypothetical protein